MAHFLRRRFLLADLKARATLISTLARIVRNLVEHPGERKYTTLKCANKALKSRVFDRPGGLEFLQALGFRARGKTSDVGGRSLVYLPAGAVAAKTVGPARPAGGWGWGADRGGGRDFAGGGGGAPAVGPHTPPGTLPAATALAYLNELRSKAAFGGG